MKKNIMILLAILNLFFFFSCHADSGDLKNSISPESLVDISQEAVYLNEDIEFTLKYNFNRLADVTYSLNGITEQSTYTNLTDSESEHKVISESDIIIRKVKDDEAELVYKDSINKMYFTIETEDNEREMVDGPRTIIHQGLKEDGSIISNRDLEATTRFLFPVTSQVFQLNTENIFPIELPFNFYGSSLILTGDLKIKCIGFYEINGLTCAKIQTSILIDERNLPQEISDENDILITGVGLHYFDINNSIFIYGNLRLQYQMDTKSVFPQTDIKLPGTDEKKEIIQKVNTMQVSTYELKGDITES